MASQGARYDSICCRSWRSTPSARDAPIRAASVSALRCPGTPSQIGAAEGEAAHNARDAHFATTLAADEGFLAAAQAQASPARRFRFAPACVEGDCAHWSGQDCRLLGQIARLLADADAPVKPRPAYDCTIRDNCRWRQERGDAACGICSFVTTEPLEGRPRFEGEGREAPH